MLFNSIEFLFFFLPVTVSVFFLSQQFINKRFSLYSLIALSLFYYSYWKEKYLIIILGSVLFNYLLANFFPLKGKKTLLTVGIAGNLIPLGFFKYSNFIGEIGREALNIDFQKINYALPLGISFFTFQQIAFLTDVYKGKTEEKNLAFYSIFVVFFPQLIAGPIVHHSEIIPQFKRKLHEFAIKYNDILKGICLFSIGLFKKVVIADSFIRPVSILFDHGVFKGFGDAWYGALCYTTQIYFDFSGYSDMAIGISLIFGILLPINFHSPYKARNIQEFWRRWHITLSKFLRDYIYIPLGGNRSGEGKTYLNIFITFLIGGIWHGAGWTFIWWGALHGLGNMLFRIFSNLNFKFPKYVSILITFLYVVLAWVFFRAPDLKTTWDFMKGMFGFHGGLFPMHASSSGIFILTISLLIAFLGKPSHSYVSKINLLKVFICSFLFLIGLLHLNQPSEFIYYDF